MQLLTITELIGHFHPVLVHLPIGILLLGGLFQLLTIRKQYAFIKPVVGLTYLFGAIGAIGSSISGYLLSRSGDYDGNTVALHQWLGIGVAFLGIGLYLLVKFQTNERLLRVLATLMILLITLTGHYGGSLTHGSDYLTVALAGGSSKGQAIPPVANVQQAKVYADLVEPLLKNRCYSCHGPEKQKGKLRLDSKDLMLKGGEKGAALAAGKAAESELIERLLLPLTDEDHMPPKEKPQLTEEELTLLKWWINEGADVHKKVSELQQPAPVKVVLPSFQTGAVKKEEKPAGILTKKVDAANAAIVDTLKKAGLVVLPIHQNSNFLSVSFVTADVTAELLKQLKELRKQVVYLDFSYTSLDNEGAKNLQGFENLLRINLRGTKISDVALVNLKALEYLELINLVETKITSKGLADLKELKRLKSIYLYKTGVDKRSMKQLETAFPNTSLDTGGYRVSTLATDTTIVKVP